MAKTEFQQELSSSSANAVYLLKTEDDIITGIVSLQNGINVNKHLTNLQEHIYTVGDIIGIIGENDPNALIYASTNYIADGDNRKVAIEKLDSQAQINASNIAANLVLIGNNSTAIQAILDSVGVADGICPLDASAKIPSIYLPDVLLEYKGVWDASLNTPTLADGTGELNDWYRVNVAGSQDLGSGSISYEVGDKVVHNGTIWEKWDTVDSVISVFGRMGAIVAQSGDYTAAQIGLGNVTDDAQLKRADADFNSFPEKVTPVAADIVLIENSEAGYSKAKVLLSNMLGGGGSGGGSFVWELNGDVSPIEETVSSISMFSFDSELESEIWAFIQVPESYGSEQIRLLGASFTSAGGSTPIPGAFSSVVVAPGDFAVEPGGVTNNLDGFTITADNEGTAGDFIDLMPDGSASVSGLVDLWNMSNPTNTATVVFDGGIDNFEVPVMGTIFFMSGGVDPSASETVLFRCQTFLNRAGQALNYQNHISVNAEVPLLVPNVLNVINEIDLTTANGEINSVQVLPNDYLAIRLYRDIANESLSSADEAKMIKFSASISFTA